MNTIALIVGYWFLGSLALLLLLTLLVNLVRGLIGSRTREEATVYELRHRPPVHPRRGAHR